MRLSVCLSVCPSVCLSVLVVSVNVKFCADLIRSDTASKCQRERERERERKAAQSTLWQLSTCCTRLGLSCCSAIRRSASCSSSLEEQEVSSALFLCRVRKFACVNYGPRARFAFYNPLSSAPMAADRVVDGSTRLKENLRCFMTLPPLSFYVEIWKRELA